MSEIKVEKKKKISKSAIVLIIGIIIIAIPCIIFAAILGIAALQTGTPREGSRFENDLVYEITEENVTNIQTSLNSISGIENLEVKVSEGQLKIFIDVKDNTSSEQIDEICINAYDKVAKELPISTYFTKTASNKMYDLDIHVYTVVSNDANREYKILHKNSAEEEYKIDDVAHPKDPELVKELLNEEEPEEDTDEQPEE